MLKIVDWNKHFETHKTRILKRMDWVAIPNKMDGDGYTELVDHPDGATHFGVWCALLSVASKCEPRGILVRAGGVPHDFASLARMTRLPSAVFAPAIRRLCAVGWLEDDNSSEINNMALSGDDTALSGVSTAETGRRMEGNGMEGNGMEDVAVKTPRRTRKQSSASPLTVETLPDEWLVIAVEKKGWSQHKAEEEFEKFSNHHLSHGKIMVSWIAAWRYWLSNADQFSRNLFEVNTNQKENWPGERNGAPNPGLISNGDDW